MSGQEGVGCIGLSGGVIWSPPPPVTSLCAEFWKATGTEEAMRTVTLSGLLGSLLWVL